MQLWLAHRDLSEAIGDSCNITLNQINDGVRFSKAKRDDYLYRAMLYVYNEILTNVSSVPHRVASRVIYNLLPNRIRYHYINISSLSPGFIYKAVGTFPADLRIMFIHSASMIVQPVQSLNPLPGSTQDQVLTIPLAILTRHESTNRTDPRYSVIPDVHIVGPMTEVSSIPQSNFPVYMIYDAADEFRLRNATGIELVYVPYPVMPQDQLASDYLDIEEAYIQKVLSLATLYALSDSQEIDAPERFLPLSLGLVPQTTT